MEPAQEMEPSIVVPKCEHPYWANTVLHILKGPGAGAGTWETAG
jgi:hypothetical protein